MKVSELLSAQYKEYLSQKSCWFWILNNRIKNEKGEPIEFKDHKFLQDIYDDDAQIQTCRKASQIGFSVLKILKTFYLAYYKKYNIIYTLPTAQDVNQLVPSKVNALISQNPILQRWTKDKDSIFQKKVGDGFIYYRGTFSGKTEKEKSEAGVGIMLSADVLNADECDRSDQDILEQYESRLAHSEYGGRWYYSNPTNPHTLSQKLYEKSDQKHWFVKCEHCNKWQYLDYWKNIAGEQFVCSKCLGVISDDARRNGRWVKKYQGREISGYWISHLIASWISAKQIQEAEANKSKAYFYNFVLGLPYRGSDIFVGRDVILRNIDVSVPNFKENNVLGCDSGLKKHYVLGNKQGIFKVGVVDKWEDIEDLIKLYDVKTAVLDALPDLTEPRKLRDKYPGKIWLCYYKKNIDKADFLRWDFKTHTVYADRTKIIQKNIDDMVSHKIRFQIAPAGLSDFIAHWESLYKTVEIDSMGLEHDVWESGGDDHLVHGQLYWSMAMEGGSGEAEVMDYVPQDGYRDPTKGVDIAKLAKETETKIYE